MFSAGELKIGLRVAPAIGVTIEDEGAGTDPVGTVTGWTLDSHSGAVGTITVRWPGGDVTTHEASLRALRRIDSGNDTSV